jgi:nucleoside-diphosphate-sugar epimerase
MTPPASPVLVTGATGNTGQAVVQALARCGVPVWPIWPPKSHPPGARQSTLLPGVTL